MYLVEVTVVCASLLSWACKADNEHVVSSGEIHPIPAQFDDRAPCVFQKAEGPHGVYNAGNRVDPPELDEKHTGVPIQRENAAGTHSGQEQDAFVDVLSKGEHYVVFEEIYDAEHLRDCIFANNKGVTLRHTVLILYNPFCEEQVQEWRILHQNLQTPDDFYLHFVIHDYATALKYTWYNWQVENDLMSWFNMTSDSCEVAFLPRGSTEQTRPVILQNSLQFQDWLWNQVKVKVTLVNAAQETIVFHFHGYHIDIPDTTLEPGHEEVIEVYTSYLMSATGYKGFYGGWKIGYNDRVVTVAMATETFTQSQFIANQYEEMEQMRKSLNKEIYDCADLHLLNRKQPLLVWNFTETGFKKLVMPEWLKRQLLEFYVENGEYPEDEVGNSLINMENRRCGVIDLDQATKSVVASGVQPLLEEWCNCDLTMTAFYGIREYYKGHRLKNHVDRVATHVISVILQIAQDLDGGPDWELEVITYEGHREQIKLKAGEMLFYESARLIHGRPRVFQGKVMANAFLHFKPTEGWLFQRAANGDLYYGDQLLAPIYPLSDPITWGILEDISLKYAQRTGVYVKDEL